MGHALSRRREQGGGAGGGGGGGGGGGDGGKEGHVWVHLRGEKKNCNNFDIRNHGFCACASIAEQTTFGTISLELLILNILRLAPFPYMSTMKAAKSLSPARGPAKV